ncbi:BGTF surface domain-containing protein [Halopelagius longus]|uniref:DUF7827 domain-containing protein n=1 Tax=Halopelagius longus TaxID=1236180 RepID=A0A1H0YCH3_9EURY|nr:BGTF surface domain-containing protein [Halopelagius longus]RDI72411.1 hypothetical protein DWB78_12180 [Halopelagius longus]SDQ12812.1 hypothetical protein SAMN05216278_0549 [Halopelagius longus]
MTRLRVAVLACVLLTVASPAAAAAADDSVTLVYEGDALTLEAGPGQVVSGETTLPPGSVLNVRMRSTGDTEPAFLKTVEATVTEHGTFEARFDLSDVSENGSVAVTVVHDGERLAEAEGELAPCDGDCADATATERDAFGGEATLSTDSVGVASVTEVTRSRTARIPVTFGDNEAVTVVVGGEEVNYRYAATVRDRDGDGRAVVLFHTENAGTPRTTASVLDDGRRTALDPIEESSLESLVDPGDYPVAVYPGENGSGDPADVGSMVVHQAPTVSDGSETPRATATTETATATPASVDSSETGLFGDDAFGIGALAAGCALGVVGVGLLLGLFRT